MLCYERNKGNRIFNPSAVLIESTARDGNYEAILVVAAGSSLGLSFARTRHPQNTKLFSSLIIDNTITMNYMLSATP